MGNKILSSVFLLSMFVLSTSDFVKWLPNKSFSLAINFKNHQRPCSKQTVVFPKVLQEMSVIDSDFSISGLVLPFEGTLEIDAVITLGPDPNDNCTEDGNAYFTPNSEANWAQPDVWSSPRFNKATPDAERIPCYDDTVQFSFDKEFTLQLPDLNQNIKSLMIGHIMILTSSKMFEEFVRYSSDTSHLMFGHRRLFVLNKFGETGITIQQKQCSSRSGCPCQENLMEMDCSLKFCSVPKCISPVQPLGHCCKICGGYLVLHIDSSFEMMAFEDKVVEIIESYGKDNLVYHIGRLPKDKVQLVVMDRNEYVGTSAYAVHAVEVAIGDSVLKTEVMYSGSPLSLAGMGGKITVSMFFLVIFVMAGVFVYFYKMPEMRSMMINRGRSVVVSRFDRRTESVVSLARSYDRRGSELSNDGDVGMQTAFRNPLYDSKRGRVQVVETVAEE